MLVPRVLTGYLHMLDDRLLGLVLWRCPVIHLYVRLAVESPSSAGRVLKVPDVAVPMQHSLLKRISAFQTKEVRAPTARAAVVCRST